MKTYAWIGLVALVLIVGAWLFRWQAIPFPITGGSRIYALDRWTGQFYLIFDTQGLFQVGPLEKP